ncbi:CBO0543 family protein [Bacillus sp. 31A1R]|uniref:CBO0543 family protein n=1 Tax=Robertmurraya mangrovi TaxID=3098077 RepID=A0ABU5IZ66_9BACI|nr:CBO0543 family protein [Bacillus sp. 31A1R]MDZ5472387.1 CBO0543 family protein [Bacillus sp. 31A1R]
MVNDKYVSLVDKNGNEIEKLVYERIDIWKEYVLFSELWWLGVALSIIPWIIWFLIRKKDSADRLMYAALFVMVISLCLDVLGDQLGIWSYRYNVIPVLPTYLPWDITLMPVTVIVILQFKPEGNPFVKALIFAIISSYLAEPFFNKLQIYNLKHWKYTYSLPIQILIYLLAHYITKKDNFALLIKSKKVEPRS